MHFECEELEPVMFVPEYTSQVPLNSSRIMLVNKKIISRIMYLTPKCISYEVKVL